MCFHKQVIAALHYRVREHQGNVVCFDLGSSLKTCYNWLDTQERDEPNVVLTFWTSHRRRNNVSVCTWVACFDLGSS